MEDGSHQEKDFSIAANSHPGNANHLGDPGQLGSLFRTDTGPNSNSNSNSNTGTGSRQHCRDTGATTERPDTGGRGNADT